MSSKKCIICVCACVCVVPLKRELVLEKNPKWEALTEVLQEIEKEMSSSEHEPGDAMTLATFQTYFFPHSEIDLETLPCVNKVFVTQAEC